MSLETIVLSGGLARGFAYLGIIKYLEEKNRYDQVKKVIGSSIGALFSIMIAKKMLYEDVRAILREYPLPDITQGCTLNNLYYIWNTYGYYTGDELKNIISVLCNGEQTFQELYNHTGVKLTIVGSNITKHRTEFFNADTTPDMPIYYAALASVAYPFVFPPVMYDGSYYVDGGLTYNVPTDYYLGDGICFILESEEKNINADINNIVDFIQNLHQTILTASDNSMTYKEVVLIRHSGIDSFNFNLGEDMLDKLMAVGYQAIGMAMYNLQNYSL